MEFALVLVGRAAIASYGTVRGSNVLINNPTSKWQNNALVGKTTKAGNKGSWAMLRSTLFIVDVYDCPPKGTNVI